MAYTINVRVIQSDPFNWFSIVEQTNWQDANGWTEIDGLYTLAVSRSGTSGILRFKNQAGDFFLVALGIHNYKRWCDIIPDATPQETGVMVHSSYYTGGSRNEILWKLLANVEKTTSKGINVNVNYYKEDGHDLYVTITITKS